MTPENPPIQTPKRYVYLAFLSKHGWRLDLLVTFCFTLAWNTSAVAVTQNVLTQPPKKKWQCNVSQKGGTKPPKTTTAHQEGSSVSSSVESSVSSSENTEGSSVSSSEKKFDFLVDSTPDFEDECQHLHDNRFISGHFTDVKGDGHCGIYCVIYFLVQSCASKMSCGIAKKRL